MPRQFHRVLSFEIEGEIYDNSTKPEDIIRNYEWKVKDVNSGIVLVGHSKNHNGRIVNLTRIPKIFKSRKVDSQYFIV